MRVTLIQSDSERPPGRLQACTLPVAWVGPANALAGAVRGAA